MQSVNDAEKCAKRRTKALAVAGKRSQDISRSWKVRKFQSRVRSARGLRSLAAGMSRCDR